MCIRDSHIGSQIFDFNFFYQAYLSLKNLADDLVSKGYKVPTLDLGGGIGINYENNQTPDFSSYKKILLDVFADTN